MVADATVDQQVRTLEGAVRRNTVARAILERAPQLRLHSWYLGAGGVTQTVWNLLHGFEPTRGIKDYDLVYFDGDDLGGRCAIITREGSTAATWRSAGS